MTESIDNVITNGKSSGLIEYLDMLSSKGYVPSPTIATLKSASKAIFTQVSGESWENVDIRRLDLNEYITRFQIKTNGKYDIKSYDAYKARVNRAIGWYLNFLEKPGWHPELKKRKESGKGSRPAKASNKIDIGLTADHIPEAEVITTNNSAGTIPFSPTSLHVANERPELIDFPFPLSNGIVAYVRLPHKLRRTDAERLQRFIGTLVIEDSDDTKE